MVNEESTTLAPTTIIPPIAPKIIDPSLTNALQPSPFPKVDAASSKKRRYTKSLPFLARKWNIVDQNSAMPSAAEALSKRTKITVPEVIALDAAAQNAPEDANSLSKSITSATEILAAHKTSSKIFEFGKFIKTLDEGKTLVQSESKIEEKDVVPRSKVEFSQDDAWKLLEHNRELHADVEKLFGALKRSNATAEEVHKLATSAAREANRSKPLIVATVALACGMIRSREETPTLDELTAFLKESKNTIAVKILLLDAYEKALTDTASENPKSSSSKTANAASNSNKVAPPAGKGLLIARSVIDSLRKDLKDLKLKLEESETARIAVEENLEAKIIEINQLKALATEHSKIKATNKVLADGLENLEKELNTKDGMLVKRDQSLTANDYTIRELTAFLEKSKKTNSELMEEAESRSKKTSALESKVSELEKLLEGRDRRFTSSDREKNIEFSDIKGLGSVKETPVEKTEEASTVEVEQKSTKEALQKEVQESRNIRNKLLAENEQLKKENEEIRHLECEVTQAKVDGEALQVTIVELRKQNCDLRLENEEQLPTRKTKKAHRLSLSVVLIYFFYFALSLMATAIPAGIYMKFKHVPMHAKSTVHIFLNSSSRWDYVSQNITGLTVIDAFYPACSIDDHVFATKVTDLVQYSPPAALKEILVEAKPQNPGEFEEFEEFEAFVVEKRTGEMVKTGGVLAVAGAVTWAGWKIFRGGNRGLAPRV